MISERDYQVEDVQSIFSQWETHRSTLYVAATGLGKTVVMVKVAKQMLPKRTIFLCHRKELIFQARDAFLRAGMNCEIEMGELHARSSLFSKSDVILATVQTLASGKVDAKRIKRQNPMDFGLLLYDESHHSVSPSNRATVDYFLNGNPNLKVLGVTATPDRLDEVALGKIFETVAAKRDILWGIDNGWLVPIKALSIRVEDMDLTGVHVTAGELNGAALAAVMEKEKPLYGLAQGALEAAFYLEPNTLHGVPFSDWQSFLLDNNTPPRSVLCFTVSVKHAEMLSDIFNRVVPDIAGWVCGETEETQRDRTNERFKDGRLTILCNCSTHTEGVDVPRAEVVIPKPTMSRSLLVQMIGRPLRPVQVGGLSISDYYSTAEDRKRAIASSKKPRCIVLDFYGVTGKHKLVSVADALGGDFEEKTRERAVENARAKMVPVDMTEEMIAAKEQLAKEAEERRRQEAARKQKVFLKSKFAVKEVNPFDKNHSSVMKTASRNASGLSEKQRAFLIKRGRNPDSMPVWAAKELIGEIFASWKR